MQPPETFQIYTDGGCLPNKRGAWSFVIISSEKIFYQQAGSARGTTCVRMELQAVIESLKVLPVEANAILWTDCRVVLEIVESKIPTWKVNNWQRSRGQPIIDLDLVRELDELISGRKIEWRWVRAHSGNFYNDFCDELCRKAYST